jgi:hypothetical protein
MTGTHRTGRSPAPGPAQDGPAAVVIAERSPRWVAMITTIILAVLPDLEVTQHSPAVLSRGHVPVALAYLAAAAAVSIWGCWRGWRMGLRLDDHGVTVRNFFHSHQFGWHEVSRFADGSVHGGEAGRLWALSVVLRDGHVITASGTSWGKRDARPQTLTAIRQAAGRHAIPAPLTGTAMRPESPGSPANPGRYPDPGGQLGSRYWSGREWSPFLRPDPASGGPEGATASAEVWSPLPGSEQQWHDAAARTRRARIAFTVWLAATAAAAAVMVALYARDLSKPHADFTSAVAALIATGFVLLRTYGAGAQRRHFLKIDRAAQAAARTVGGQGSAADVNTDVSSGMEGQGYVQQLSAEQRSGVRRARRPLAAFGQLDPGHSAVPVADRAGVRGRGGVAGRLVRDRVHRAAARAPG